MHATQTITFGLRKCNTSIFLSFAGGIFYYILLQGSLWWIFHVSVLFYGIQFPFHSRSFKAAHRTKYIHVIMVVIALLLPLVPAIVCGVIGEYTMTDFPPILCVGSDADATFYSLVLPIIIILGTGTSLLVIMFWKIHMVHKLLLTY